MLAVEDRALVSKVPILEERVADVHRRAKNNTLTYVVIGLVVFTGLSGLTVWALYK